MNFRTRLDITNRQVKQYEKTDVALSGSSTFGIPYSALTSGPDLSMTGFTFNDAVLPSTYSGNTGTTVYTFGDPRMYIDEGSLVPLTPSNSGNTQFAGPTWAGYDMFTTVDGYTGWTSYSAVTYDVEPDTMVDLGGGAYSGTFTSDFTVYSGGSFDYTGSTIWVDVYGITRTDELIITKDAVAGYVAICDDSTGKVVWGPASSGGTSGSTSPWTAGTGTNSAVLGGSDGIASGVTSVAEGSNTIAGGDYSHAEGDTTYASGLGSHAEGSSTIASGDYSHSEGQDTTASGDSSHAEGKGTTASGTQSHAEGLNTIASGSRSHAEGFNGVASGDYSHAEGQSTVASGNQSHAEGATAIASGNVSHAEGSQTLASGNTSHAEGYRAKAHGDYSHAEGYQTLAGGYASHAEGIDTVTVNDGDHAEGRDTVASGFYCHAEGFNTTASAVSSHAEGQSTVASGAKSHAEGEGSVASGVSSHAEGGGTLASGLYSHAQGNNTTASGTSAHSEGTSTVAGGDYSHASGYFTTANGLYSSVLGGSGTTIGVGASASSIIGGLDNEISTGSTSSGIFSSENSFIGNSQNSTILGSFGTSGNLSSINDCFLGTVIGGLRGKIEDSDYSMIIGGKSCNIDNTTYSATPFNGSNTILNSDTSRISSAARCAIIGGSGNLIDYNITYSAVSVSSGIFAGASNTISGHSNSVILGGDNNTINFDLSSMNAIVGGQQNLIEGGGFDILLGGTGNTIQGQAISSTDIGNSMVGGISNTLLTGITSSMIAGENNVLVATTNSAIIGGIGITGTSDNMVYVPDLVIDGLTSTDPLATNANGMIVAGASDKRLKTNIQVLDSALDKIKNLRGVSYEWTEESNMGAGVKKYGLIAQEVQEVIPDMVRERSKGDGMLTLSYTEVVPWLIEAIKELSSGSTKITNEQLILETQTIASEDNNIELNYGGNHETSVGGGITVLDGVSKGVNAEIKTDEKGNWIMNPPLTTKEYTPTSTNDEFGKIGDTVWDNDYTYIKTNAGWRRSSLENF